MSAERTGVGETEDGPALQSRRALLLTDANPGQALDYLNMLSGNAGSAVRITMRYVPDKLTLRPAAFSAYLDCLEALAAQPLEQLAIAALEDINNEVVPRWVQILAERDGDLTANHRVLVEDRQPKWDNAALLGRLERF